MSRSNAPIVRPTAWISVIPHLLIMSGLVGLARTLFTVHWSSALYLGLGIFLLYSLGSRAVLAREHKAGIRCTKKGDFAGAIPHYERSYDFFERHRWVDRWRYVTMLSSGQYAYREMALVNIAFCYSQMGDGKRATEYYRRALKEFPDSTLAQAGLRMAESFQSAAPSNAASPSPESKGT